VFLQHEKQQNIFLFLHSCKFFSHIFEAHQNLNIMSKSKINKPQHTVIVKDSEGNVRPAYNPKKGYEDLVTNAAGILEDLKMTVGAGTYYLREKAAPSGYKLLPEDLCFTIGANGTVKINNAGYTNWLRKDTSVAGTVSYTITIENTPLGITVRKTDENGHGLPGSKFVLCKKNDAGSFVVVTDYGLGPDGVINLTDTTEMTFSGISRHSRSSAVM
jgi:uncharacterized surface anchored protein